MTPGYILAGKYRLVSVLGRGGMGAVWRAERLEWGSAVAVKLMERASEARPDVLNRFLQEARLAANLRSSHVVQVLDDGRDVATGTPFIVMELLEGETLAQRLARVRTLTPAQTSRVVTHVARALALAHELGMVHRDLKPDNIFLVRNDDEETAKVLDFGIAKWNVESFLADARTTTGTAIGTPSYMSPEQIKDSKRVDHRTDLWSLALIASECLTGRRAFEADNLLSLALSICNEAPPLPSSQGSVPSGVDAWFRRATARDIGRRYGSARELAEELRRVCGVPSAISERSAPEHAPPAPDAYEPTEVLDSPSKPRSTDGLTRTQGAVAAFRRGHARTRALVLGVALLLLAGLVIAVRSEVGVRAVRAKTGLQALRPLPGTAGAGQVTEPAPAPWVPARVVAVEPAPPPEGSAAPALTHEPSESPPKVALRTAGAAPIVAAPPSPAMPALAATPPSAAAVASELAAGRGAPSTADPAAAPSAAPTESLSTPAAAPVAAPAASPASTPDQPSTLEAAATSAPMAAEATAATEPTPASTLTPELTSAPEARAMGGPGLDPPRGKPFDREAARAALEAVALRAQSCRPPGGPHGRGRVQVRFEPSGKVSAVWMMTPLFDNTVTGSCVLMLFRRATIPEFEGDGELVLKSFEVP